MNAFAGLLAVALSMLPVYLSGSGGVQVSHALLALFCVWYISSRGFSMSQVDMLILGLSAYVFARESIDIFLGRPRADLMPATYVFFAFLVVNVLRRAVSEPKFESAIRFGFAGAAIIALCGVLILGGVSFVGSADDARAIGTFNNPNQLGYFSVCLLAGTFALRLYGMLTLKMTVMLAGIALLLAVASLSKAAIISCAGAAMLLGHVSVPPRYSKMAGMLFVITAVSALGFVYAAGLLDEFTFVQRLQSIGSDSDDSLEARGYFRLLDASPLMWIFGMGASGVFAVSTHEVHSTIFYFVVTYGFVGGIMFCTLVAIWCTGVYRRFGFTGLLTVCGPILIYGITHNGSRFVIFWVVVALCFAREGCAAQRGSVGSVLRPR